MTNADSKDKSSGHHAAPFTESGAWRDVGAGWQPLFGSFRGAGYSIEWHDFFAKRELDWAASFHPDCVELCLNLDGHGFVEGRGDRADFAPNTAVSIITGTSRSLPGVPRTNCTSFSPWSFPVRFWQRIWTGWRPRCIPLSAPR